MAMATAVVNKELSLTEHMAAAKAALATAPAHVATLTGTFPDTLLAGGRARLLALQLELRIAIAIR